MKYLKNTVLNEIFNWNIISDTQPAGLRELAVPRPHVVVGSPAEPASRSAGLSAASVPAWSSEGLCHKEAAPQCCSSCLAGSPVTAESAAATAIRKQLKHLYSDTYTRNSTALGLQCRQVITM